MDIDVRRRRQIAALANRQHANVTRQQLLNLGLGAQAIAYRVRNAELFPVHPGVYGVGKPPKQPLERAAAAVLACGPTAALSHESAIVLWQIWRRWPGTPEVSVTRHRRPRGIAVHQPRSLSHHEITSHRGIRTTTLARALFDIAPRTAPKTLTRAVNNALNSPYLIESQLADVLSRHPRHPATRLLAQFVSETQNGLTRSELEDKFKSFCHTYGFPRPKTNVLVGGYLVDAYFEAERLIVELDSWSFHHTRTAFEADRNRDVEALIHGVATVRITHQRLEHDPDREAARLQTILEQRR